MLMLSLPPPRQRLIIYVDAAMPRAAMAYYATRRVIYATLRSHAAFFFIDSHTPLMSRDALRRVDYCRCAFFIAMPPLLLPLIDAMPYAAMRYDAAAITLLRLRCYADVCRRLDGYAMLPLSPITPFICATMFHILLPLLLIHMPLLMPCRAVATRCHYAADVAAVAHYFTC